MDERLEHFKDFGASQSVVLRLAQLKASRAQSISLGRALAYLSAWVGAWFRARRPHIGLLGRRVGQWQAQTPALDSGGSLGGPRSWWAVSWRTAAWAALKLAYNTRRGCWIGT